MALNPRWIHLEGSVNARDVGGLAGAGGRQVKPGVLLRSANLQALTTNDVDRLVRFLRVRRVLDLRTDVELRHEGATLMHAEAEVLVHHLSLYHDHVEDSLAEADGASPVLLPWGKDFDGDRPDPTVASYLRYLARRPDSIVAALRAISEPDGATLVHCAAGKDRTGVVIALALCVAGVSWADVSADYAATAEQMEAVYQLLGGSAFYSADIAKTRESPPPRAETMMAFLQSVDHDYGGIQTYLSINGFDTAEFMALQERLLC